MSLWFSAGLLGAALALLRFAERRRTMERLLGAAAAQGERGASRSRRWLKDVRRRRSSPAPHEEAFALAALASALSASLRGGRTLVQALQAAAADDGTPGWVRTAVGRVLSARSVGESLDAALGGLAADVPGPAELIVTALRVGARTGVGLPALLDQVSGSLRARATAHRDLHVQTTQARLSGTVLCLLPLGFFVFAALSSARDVLPVLASRAGAAAVVAGLVLQAAGVWSIRRIVRVEL